MAYTLNFVADFGSLTGLTLYAKLYDDAGVQTGPSILTGFVEIGNGVYSYKHTTIPSGHRGAFVMYKASDATIKVSFSVNPEEAERIDVAISSILSVPGGIIGPALSGTTLTVTRAVTFNVTITGLTIPASWSIIYFTAKTSQGDLDAAAIIQIKESVATTGDGLLWLNGAAISGGLTLNDGTITVNQAAGTIAIAFTDDMTAQLTQIGQTLAYDLKAITSGSTSIVMTAGLMTIASTPTRTV